VAAAEEAAVRSGIRCTCAAAHRRLVEVARPSGTDWALGLEARSRALVSEGEVAEHLYREAIDRLGRTRSRVDLARAVSSWQPARRSAGAASRPATASNPEIGTRLFLSPRTVQYHLHKVFTKLGIST